MADSNDNLVKIVVSSDADRFASMTPKRVQRELEEMGYPVGDVNHFMTYSVGSSKNPSYKSKGTEPPRVWRTMIRRRSRVQWDFEKNVNARADSKLSKDISTAVYAYLKDSSGERFDMSGEKLVITFRNAYNDMVQEIKKCGYRPVEIEQKKIELNLQPLSAPEMAQPLHT